MLSVAVSIPKIQSKSNPWGLAYYCFVQPLSFILQTQCHYFSYLVTYRLIHVANACRVRLFGPTHSDDLVQGSSDFFPMHWKYTQTKPRQTGVEMCYLHFFAVNTKESVIQPQIYVVQHNRTRAYNKSFRNMEWLHPHFEQVWISVEKNYQRC